ncbi:MAG TPA: phage tail tape measure protein, partial [Streptosporangiaceae bacterium]
MMAGVRSVIINLIANDRVTDTVKGIGKQFDKLNRQIGKMAAPAMAAAGAAAGGAFVAGISGAIQLDSARGKLEAQLGLTKDQSKRVGDVAGRVFSQAYGESMEEVQGAITSVIQNMDGMRTASNAALEQTTKRALDVATVMDEEVGSVTRAVSQMLKTGLAKNAQEAFDILTAGTQRGANKAQDLLDTFNEYSTQFRDMGLSGQQAMGILQQGLQGGARDADLVADALKEMNIRVQDLSAGPALKKLGLDADAMSAAFGRGGAGAAKALDTIIDRLRAVQDPTERYQLAQQILGTQSEDLAKAFLKIDPSSAVKALGQVGGAADRAGQALGGTAQARFTAFTRTLQQDVMGALGATLGWFQQHTTVAKVLAAAVGVLVAAYLTYNTVSLVMAARLALVTEGTVAHTIVTKVAAAATKVWAATTWLLNGAMAVLTSPITLVVVAIGLLVAAVVLAYKKNETFRSVVQAVWAGIKSAIGAVWGFLQPVFMAIKTIVGAVLPRAMTFLVNTAKVAWLGIQIAVKIAWTLIKGYLTAIKWYVTNVVAPVFRWLWSNVIKPVWSGISAAIKWAWTNQIRPVFNALKSGVHLVASGFRVSVDAIKKHWDRIKDIAKKPVNFVLSVYNRGIVDVVNKISKFAGLDTRLSPIKMLARGGTLDNPAKARPMVTNGAIAIAGEGKRQHPEYVIPTDPAYRKRAQALWAAAGQDLAGRGGGGGRN